MEEIETENNDSGIDFVKIGFHIKRIPHAYPSCGGITETAHDYRIQKIKDLPIQE